MNNLLKILNNYFLDLEKAGENIASFVVKKTKSKTIINQNNLFESLEIRSRYLIVNDTYHRILFFSQFPAVINPEHIYRLINSLSRLDLAIHINKWDRSEAIRRIKLRRSVLESDSNMRAIKGKKSDEYVNKELLHLETMLGRIINNNEDVFRTSIYLSLKADSEVHLINKDRELKEFATGLDFEINTCSFQQLEGFNCILPMADDALAHTHDLLTSNLLSILPFHYKEHIEETGIFLGFNKIGGGIFIKDLLKGANMNITIFGSSGSGKSVTAKILILRFLLQRIRMVIFDPEGEYINLCREINAKVFTISEQEGLDIVVLIDSLKCSTNLKVEMISNFLFSLTKVPLKEALLISKELKKFLKSQVDHTFKALVGVLVKFESMHFLKSLVSGSTAPLFIGNRRLDINDRVVCFDLSGIYSENLKTSIVMLIANIVDSLLKDNKVQTLIFIDEAHKLLVNEQIRNFYINLVKTARKRKAGVVSITQNPEDMNEENGSRIIISQAEHIFLLKHSTASLNYIKRYQLFDLNEADYNNIAKLDKGCALLLSARERFYLDIFPFERERSLIFT